MTARIRLVAPNMGTLDQGIQAFTTVRAPYVRGGGTLSAQVLEDACIAHLWNTGSQEATGQRPDAVILASGQAANHLAFSLFRGAHIVSSNQLFGTTKVALTQGYERNGGGKVTYVAPEDTQAFVNATNPATRAWFVEAISNPAGRVPDFDSLKSAAQRAGVVLIVDSTLAAGMPGFKGADYADILTTSLTKQAGGGNNTNVGGSVIVQPGFPSGRSAADYPELGRYFADAQGNLNLPSNPFAALIRKLGTWEGSCTIAPQGALSIARSLPGLPERVQRQMANAKAAAAFLCEHPKVQSLHLAGVHSDAANDARAQRYLGGNGIVALMTLHGGLDAARAFVDSGAIQHAVALGQKRSAVAHPATSTHRQYDGKQQAEMGIFPGTLRLSIGAEAERTVLSRLKRALAAVP